ncbi:MAG: hypothetical protein ACTSV7_03140 [Candidatus Baldrarchaeia archaeon]
MVANKRFSWRIVKEIRKILREEELSEEAKETLERYLREFKLRTVDVGIFESLNPKPGFTVPIVLPPSILYLGMEVSRGTKYWDESVIKTELETHLGATKDMDEEYRKKAEIIAKSLDEI